MKLEPATKLIKGNASTPEKFDNHVTPVNFDLFDFFSFYGQFVVIRKPDPVAWCIKITFSLIVTFILQKFKTGTKIPLTKPLYYCFKVLFLQKIANFCKKIVDISKIKEYQY